MSQLLQKRLISKNNKWVTFIIVIFYGLYFLKMVFGASTIVSFILNTMMLSIGFMATFFIVYMKRLDYKSKILITLFLLYLFGASSSLISANYRIQDYLLPIQYMGIGLLMIKYLLDYKITRYSFFFYVAFFGFNIITNIHPNEVFIVSRNNISTIMIIQCIILYISMFQNNIKIKLYPAIITVIICVWAIGRSGILASLLLLLSIILYSYIKSNNKSIKFISIVFIVFSVVCMLSVFYYDAILKSAIERPSNSTLLDPARSMINTEYINKATSSFKNFFFGPYLFDNDIFAIYDFNLHNSYTRLHSLFGVMGVLVVGFILIRSVAKYIRVGNMLYLSLLLVLLARMSTDILAFHGPSDPLIYFFSLNGFCFKKDINLERAYYSLH